jgi:riboflavin biosynthesis pyrimidine reductase
MEPIVTLYEREPAPATTLPDELADVYGGGLLLPERQPGARPYAIANFVETLDGVVSYELPGRFGGGAISGESEADHAVMGILRAAADAVIFGSGSLHKDSGHVRTPAFIYPPLAAAYAALRERLGRTEPLPLSVVASASGRVDLDEPTFHTPDVRALIVTTPEGAVRLARASLPPTTEVRAVAADTQGGVEAAALLELLGKEYDVRVALHEGGPRLLASFLREGLIDELFLTLSPSLAGRAAGVPRLALVEGLAFVPEAAPWATLLSAKLARSHLLLRYQLRSPSTVS